MRQNIKEFLSMHHSSTKQIYKRRIITAILSLLVVLGVANYLKLPADTLQHAKKQQRVKGLQCELMDANLGDQVIIIHTHDEYCLEEWCTLSEQQAHEHIESCYKEDLICDVVEVQNLSLHQHDETCYEIAKQLSCRLLEVETHQHTDACNTIQLSCRLLEGEIHTHDETCYHEIKNLVCEKIDEPAEHTHTETCYSQIEMCRVVENEITHQHTEACYLFEDKLPIVGNEDILPDHGDIKLFLSTTDAAGDYKFDLFVDSEEEVDWSSIADKQLLYTKKNTETQWTLYWDTFKQTAANQVSMNLTFGEWDLNTEYYFKNIPQIVSLVNHPEEVRPIKLRITKLSGEPVNYVVNGEMNLNGEIEIQAGGVMEITIEAKTEANFDTEDTVLDYFEDGKYSIENILKNYNIFSFSDIESTHIVGPIVAKDKAYRTRDEGPLSTTPDEGHLTVSDWARDIPSYIGQLINTPVTEGDSNSVRLNYYFDSNENHPVNLYISTQTELLYREIYQEKLIVFKEGERETISPNRSGRWPVLRNDDFIDWEGVKGRIESQAGALMENPNSIRVGTIELRDHSELPRYTINETNGYLEIDAGKNYLIEDASRLRLVNIIYPEGYGPVGAVGPDGKPLEQMKENTIINIKNPAQLAKEPISFSSIQIGSNTVNGKSYQSIWDDDVINDTGVYLFPTVFINGWEYGPTGMGEGEEYHEDGTSIIWNMPEVSGRVLKQDPYEILGYIIAPNAEFWAANNHSDDGWTGGNLNGSAIVKSYHGGRMQAHMYPYNGDLQEETLSLEGTKKLYDNGILEPVLAEGEFKFILARADDHEGVLDRNLPQTVSVAADGTIKFLPITFPTR